MNDSLDTSPTPATDHPLRMTGRSAFYSFSFDLGPDLDYVGLADKLLRTDMATVAGSPSRDGLRIGRRTSQILKFHRHAKRSADFFNTLYSGNPSWKGLWHASWEDTIKVAFKSPRTIFAIPPASAFLGKFRTRRQETESVDLEHRAQEISNSVNMMNENVQLIQDVFMHQLTLGAVRLRLAQQIYFPRYYLRTEPFIRLEMNRVYFADDTHDDEPIEISLMIHRSGVCIMTFATSIGSEFDLDRGHDVMLGSARHFRRIKISDPIMSRQGAYTTQVRAAIRPESGIHDGLTWTTFDSTADQSHDLSMEGAFLPYLDAIENIAGKEILGEWRCNTTLFQGTPLCGCDGAEAKERHAVEFGQLMVRSRSPFPIKEELRQELLTNHLITTHAELWLAAGNAIHTYWHRTDIDYTDDLHVLESIEFAILQYRQLEAIDTRTVNIAVHDRDLLAAQIQLVTNLPEYGRNLLTDQSAALAVDGLAEKLKTPQLYSRLNDRVKVLESIVNTRYTRKQSRRSLTISTIGLAIVVLLLLPRVIELMDKLAKLSPTGSLIQSVEHIFGSHDRAVVGIYLIAVALAVLLFVVLVAKKPTLRRRRHKRTFGYDTKHDIVVVREPATARDTTDTKVNSSA